MIKWHVDKIKGIVLQTNCEKWDSNQAEQSHTFDPSQPGTYSASLLLQLRFMPVGRFGTPVLYHLITLQYLRTSSYTDSARTLQSSKQFRLKLCSQSIIGDFPCSVNCQPHFWILASLDTYLSAHSPPMPAPLKPTKTLNKNLIVIFEFYIHKNSKCFRM